MKNAGTLRIVDRRAVTLPLRRAGAVLGALVAVIVVTTITDVVLHAAGFFPPWGQRVPDALLLLATGYRIVFGVAGSYLAGRLAPDRPMTHALALGVVGLALSIAGAVATWNGGPAFEPKWYPLALIVVALPSAWAGGALLGAQRRASGASEAATL